MGVARAGLEALPALQVLCYGTTLRHIAAPPFFISAFVAALRRLPGLRVCDPDCEYAQQEDPLAARPGWPDLTEQFQLY